MNNSFNELTGLGRFIAHSHSREQHCPGYPSCYEAYTTISALAETLVEATIRFANTTICDTEQVPEFFNGAIAPTDIPRLRECREIHTSLRSRLTANSATEAVPNIPVPTVAENKGGYTGLSGIPPAHAFIVAEPILLDHQAIGLRPYDAAHTFSVEFYYRFANATLNELVNIGMAFILEAELQDKIGLCAREGCDNIFLDTKSRGVRRKYCKLPKCEKVIAAERVAKSRSKRK